MLSLFFSFIYLFIIIIPWLLFHLSNNFFAVLVFHPYLLSYCIWINLCYTIKVTFYFAMILVANLIFFCCVIYVCCCIKIAILTSLFPDHSLVVLQQGFLAKILSYYSWYFFLKRCRGHIHFVCQSFAEKFLLLFCRVYVFAVCCHLSLLVSESSNKRVIFYDMLQTMMSNVVLHSKLSASLVSASFPSSCTFCWFLVESWSRSEDALDVVFAYQLWLHVMPSGKEWEMFQGITGYLLWASKALQHQVQRNCSYLIPMWCPIALFLQNCFSSERLHLFSWLLRDREREIEVNIMMSLQTADRTFFFSPNTRVKEWTLWWQNEAEVDLEMEK